ncbi:MAG: trigger factor [Alloprevotella sp.]|nr:trigger factor [Alloprevotella sp.]
MNVSMQKTSEVSGRLTVEVTAADYADRVKEELKKIGKTHTIPGFRKGHVSINDLQRRFGRQVTSDVINEIVYKAVIDYINDNKLEVLGHPVPVELVELDLKNKSDFTFEYDLALAPSLNIDLKADGITIPYYPIEVSDEMVKEQDEAFRKRFGAQVPGEVTEPDALVKGSLMELNADGGIKEGEGAIQVTSTIVSPRYFTSEEERKKFEDKKVGDKVVFNPWNTCNGNPAELSSMLQIDKEKAPEAKADFELTISEIIVVKPAEHDEEFFTNVFGKDKVHNEEEYATLLREMISAQLSGNSDMVFRADARRILLERYGDMELPAEILKRWLISRSAELTDENIDEEYSRMVPDLKWQLITDKIAENLGLEVTDDDRLDYARGMARQQFAQYGMTNMDDATIDGFAKNILADKQWGPRINEQVATVKLFAAIKENVTIDEKPLSLDAFREMVDKLNSAE